MIRGPDAGDGRAADGPDNERRGIHRGQFRPFTERDRYTTTQGLPSAAVLREDLEHSGASGVRLGVVHDHQAADVLAVHLLVIGDGDEVADGAGKLVVPAGVAADEAAFQNRRGRICYIEFINPVRTAANAAEKHLVVRKAGVLTIGRVRAAEQRDVRRISGDIISTKWRDQRGKAVVEAADVRVAACGDHRVEQARLERIGNIDRGNAAKRFRSSDDER